MEAKRRDVTIHKKILREIADIEAFIANETEESFAQSRLAQKAVMMTLINIAELSKSFSLQRAAFPGKRFVACAISPPTSMKLFVLPTSGLRLRRMCLRSKTNCWRTRRRKIPDRFSIKLHFQECAARGKRHGRLGLFY